MHSVIRDMTTLKLSHSQQDEEIPSMTDIIQREVSLCTGHCYEPFHSGPTQISMWQPKHSRSERWQNENESVLTVLRTLAALAAAARISRAWLAWRWALNLPFRVFSTMATWPPSIWDGVTKSCMISKIPCTTQAHMHSHQYQVREGVCHKWPTINATDSNETRAATKWPIKDQSKLHTFQLPRHEAAHINRQNDENTDTQQG